jgi:hypothetical protein
MPRENSYLCWMSIIERIFTGKERTVQNKAFQRYTVRQRVIAPLQRHTTNHTVTFASLIFTGSLSRRSANKFPGKLLFGGKQFLETILVCQILGRRLIIGGRLPMPANPLLLILPQQRLPQHLSLHFALHSGHPPIRRFRRSSPNGFPQRSAFSALKKSTPCRHPLFRLCYAP